MSETARLDGLCNGFELDFVERIATPKRVMELGIHLHLSGLSLSNTVSVLESLGVSRVRSTVHNWVQKADFEPRDGRDPEKIALDETVVKVNGDRFWLYAAVEPETNVILHVRLYPSRTIVLTKMFLRELGRNTRSRMPNSSWMEHRGYRLVCSNSACTFVTRRMAIGIRLNVFFKR